MLFTLAAETLQTLIEEVQHNLVQTSDSKTKLLQYADDMIIFKLAHPQKPLYNHGSS
jgi:hypothetical protein